MSVPALVVLPVSKRRIEIEYLASVQPITLAAAPRGKSAYQLWLDAGNVGTVEEFLAAILQEVSQAELDAEASARATADTAEANARAAADNVIEQSIADEVAARIAAVAGKADRAVVRVFTSSGTWNKPAGLTSAYVVCIGAGGGGRSGTRYAPSGVTRAGGQAGGGGGWTDGTFACDVLGATEAVIVGAGGVGAPGATVDNTAAVAGGNGGESSFGSLVIARGTSNNGQAGGTGSVFGQSSAGGFSDGSPSQNTSTANRPGGLAPGAGGSGNGFNSANVPSSMTNRGHGGWPGYGCGDAGPAPVAAPGVDGASAPAREPGDIRGAFGGAGGGSTSGAPGGNGGNGGFPGGGGGGGSASDNGFVSGAGGNGGNGEVIVVECF